jgi:hypothetical protein
MKVLILFFLGIFIFGGNVFADKYKMFKIVTKFNHEVGLLGYGVKVGKDPIINSRGKEHKRTDYACLSFDTVKPCSPTTILTGKDTHESARADIDALVPELANLLSHTVVALSTATFCAESSLIVDAAGKAIPYTEEDCTFDNKPAPEIERNNGYCWTSSGYCFKSDFGYGDFCPDIAIPAGAANFYLSKYIDPDIKEPFSGKCTDNKIDTIKASELSECKSGPASGHPDKDFFGKPHSYLDCPYLHDNP